MRTVVDKNRLSYYSLFKSLEVRDTERTFRATGATNKRKNKERNEDVAYAFAVELPLKREEAGRELGEGLVMHVIAIIPKTGGEGFGGGSRASIFIRN
jgi:hypothetical protein